MPDFTTQRFFQTDFLPQFEAHISRAFELPDGHVFHPPAKILPAQYPEAQAHAAPPPAKPWLYIEVPEFYGSKRKNVQALTKYFNGMWRKSPLLTTFFLEG